VRPTAKSIVIIVVVAVVELVWALYAAATSANLLLFYAVLVVLSVVFFVPGMIKLEDDATDGNGDAGGRGRVPVGLAVAELPEDAQ
jgi:hypothetical protein